MNAFDLLSEPIRRYIRSQNWAALRPIQVASIERILGTSENYILSSRTASGKTEAAFLPILSAINPDDPGVQVLYISPLIALINDQFFRIEELTKYLNIKITKWHGEASRSQKESLLKNPSGILFITPESIEALFVNRPDQLARLFVNLKFIIVDEVHSFLGTNRGIHLRSLLSRIQPFAPSVRYMGLSATIANYEIAKNFFGAPERTKVLRDSTPQPVTWTLNCFEGATAELPEPLLDALYEGVKDRKTLIFPNSRGRVEEIAVKFKKRVERDKSNLQVFAHHSSVNRDVRGFAEHFAKTSNRLPYAIVCTSTLELGIDIGAVDLIVQVDSTGSVSSLAQRLGRSGRKEGSESSVNLLVTDEWNELQSLASILLFKEGRLEPPESRSAGYDVLFHQILSTLKQFSGVPKADLADLMSNNFAFKKIPKLDIIALIDQMIQDDFIQDLRRELIVGYSAEKLVNSRDFYSVFDPEQNLKVFYGEKTIGELQPSPDLKIGFKVYLSAGIWVIKDIDYDHKKIWVKPSPDARIPRWLGAGIPIHRIIREKMLAILHESDIPTELSVDAVASLELLRRKFQSYALTDLSVERPAFQTTDSIRLYTFSGTTLNSTLHYLATQLKMKVTLNERQSALEFTGETSLDKKFPQFMGILENIEDRLRHSLNDNPNQFKFGKWAQYLNQEFKLKLLLETYFDVGETRRFCREVRIVYGMDSKS